MMRIRVVSAMAAVAASVGLTLGGTAVALAQDATQTASVPTSASTPKQIQKAQRKAAHKAARAKKNAELSTLEKNGYHMSGGKQTDYPENVESAERKAHASQAGAGASSPGQ
ncbi:hypothetical protein SB861_45580 [Paraburkholderia sp. SIMBA_049]